MAGAGPRERKGAKQRTAAEERPVARVLVDVPLPVHLDRPFDYLVPDRLDADAVPGCRVRVRFRGKLVDGYLLERVDTSDFQGRLSWVERVPSPEPVLTPSLLEMARAVADRYGGMLADVVRLAVPPRHAGAEKSAPTDPGPPPERPAADGWARYRHGSSFVDAVHEGRAARAVWQALPGEDWPERLAEAVAVAASAGRGALVVVPDHRDLQRLHAACARLLGESGVVALAAELAPAERYRRWLAVLRGAVRVVVGTRAAMFAPVHHLGLAVVWDDGDELHNYPQVPYPHARDVLTLRAHAAGAALVVGGFARTAEAALLVESGYAHELVAPRADVRSAAPRVTAIGEDDSQLARDPAARAARLPSVAFQAARAALGAGAPVLVQVPRRGYVPALACGDCRERARCRRCAGPLALPGGGEGGAPKPAACRWCGATEAAFRCPNCGSRRLRAVAVGAGRTAEELGRAFTGVPVRTSGGGDVLATVPAGPALVVCTPGAEPVAEGGYGAALLLDGRTLLGRPELRAAETALRLWFAAAALVRPASEGGRVVVMAESSLQPVQALVRWDPAWYAALELAERAELGFPPARRVAAVDGTPDAVESLLDSADLPATAEVLGPVPLGEPDEDGVAERERLIVRVDRAEGRSLAAALHHAQAVRGARKATELQVRLDPPEML
ncbi:primosomal protein N' [Saccharopolyspora rosea]|uniref:Probable replication restart protein PriA n=1 Tax=Saccharopolyspora rosea TaxID=524884 RepID=A0ABW3FUN1_9PSEU